MIIRYTTKRQLARINQTALKGRGRAIDPSFVDSLPAQLRFPVDKAVPFQERPGWVRCFVTVGTTLPPETGDPITLLLDIPERDFKQLACVDCPDGQ